MAGVSFINDFPARCAEAVARIEQKSAAEVVVVVAPRSGSYADADLLWGILAGLAALAYILHGPVLFSPEMVIVNLLLVGGLAWWLSRRSEPLRRLVTTAARRRVQVEEAARSIFVGRGLGATRQRTGILLYLSLLEHEAVLLPDYGAQGRVPGVDWNEARACLQTANLEEGLFKALTLLEEKLPERLPRAEGDRDELPDEPVML